jgi:dATP pyrophosphohydrolase
MIEPGETAHDAARREAIEETGLKPQRFFRIDNIEQFYSEHTDAVHLVPAFASYVEDVSGVTISEEHTEYAWCALDDVLNRLIWRSQREAVRILAEAMASWPDVGPGMTELTAVEPAVP